MVSLIVHLVLGFATLAFIVKTNPSIFARYSSGPQVTGLELFYYVVGIASVVLGCYFNNQYVAEYAPPGGLHNFIWGPGSWWEFITLGYANPAASSASQDYTIINLLLLPAVDHRRRPQAWHQARMAVLRVHPVHQLRLRVGGSTWPSSSASTGTSS